MNPVSVNPVSVNPVSVNPVSVQCPVFISRGYLTGEPGQCEPGQCEPGQCEPGQCEPVSVQCVLCSYPGENTIMKLATYIMMAPAGPYGTPEGPAGCSKEGPSGYMFSVHGPFKNPHAYQ